MRQPKDLQNLQCTYFIQGMHCSSCEILIEKKLIDEPNIHSTQVSLAMQTVSIQYQPNAKPSAHKLNQLFVEDGYNFSTQPTPPQKPLFSLDQGELVINKEKTAKWAKILLLLIVFVVAFIGIEQSKLGKYISINEQASLGAFFALGLVAGISSCAALVGGILLSQMKQWNEQYLGTKSDLIKARPHVLFHAARLFSFFVLGGLLGLFGNAITINNTNIYSALVIGVSIIMLILGLQMLDFRPMYRLKIAMPNLFGKKIIGNHNQRSPFQPLIMGAMTFFLPCGFTLIAQSIALISGSFLSSAFIMFFFALGTLPSLTIISISGIKFNKSPRSRAYFNLAAGLIVLFFGLYNINGQLNVLGLPSLSDIDLNFAKKDITTQAYNPNEVQQLKLIAKGFEYIPQSPVTIYSGIKTQLVVDNQGIQGCGSFIAARGLFNGYVNLKSGENVIDVGMPKPGTYKITCSMGMVSPITVTVL